MKKSRYLIQCGEMLNFIIFTCKLVFKIAYWSHRFWGR